MKDLEVFAVQTQISWPLVAPPQEEIQGYVKWLLHSGGVHTKKCQIAGDNEKISVTQWVWIFSMFTTVSRCDYVIENVCIANITGADQ